MSVMEEIVAMVTANRDAFERYAEEDASTDPQRALFNRGRAEGCNAILTSLKVRALTSRPGAKEQSHDGR